MGDYDTTYTYAGNIEMSDAKPVGLPEDDIYVQINYAPGHGQVTAIDKYGRFDYPGVSGGFFHDRKKGLSFTVSSMSLSASNTNGVSAVRR